MNDASSSSWSTAEHYDPMGAPTDHDFGNLLDFDNIDLDFSIDYTNSTPAEHDSTRQLTELADTLDLQHLQNHFSPHISHEHGHPHAHGNANGGVGVPHHHQHQHQHQQQNMSRSLPQNSGPFFDFNMGQYNQTNMPAFSQPQDQVYRPHAGVPPTPNSVEMHGDPARYLQQLDPQQTLFDQRFNMRKDETFTPLVSPAVTPHEARFQIPDFTTVPGAYFSPLTSPALNAQNHQQQQALSSQYTTSGSSTGTSPVDVDMDLGESAMAQPEQGRKLRSTKRSAPRSNNATSRVRQSPIVKPGRRKATVSSLIPPKEVSELVEEAQRSKSRSASNAGGLEVPRSGDSSEVSSVSPEPLMEMGPPPLPGSVTHSPALHAQANQKNGNGVCPATPASLMRLQQSPNLGEPSDMPSSLDDLTLPEATLERPSLDRLDTAIHDDDQATPRMGARKTPKLGPLSTPGSAILSANPSPMLSAIASPTSPAFSQGNGKRSDPKQPRNLKKRGSVSSALVSPALRPKISPSIKPLLPEGGSKGNVTEDTHALLLASKSNYQNILDGTTVPGVVYPTSLSTNLTSKRTSHKIAEQGRRNRINTALQEMQALLPSPQIAAANAKEAKSSPPESAAAQSNNSKAAKVESAIEYIKQLQKQCSDKDKEIDRKDQEMEALRKELAALKGASSAASTTSTTADEEGMKTDATVASSSSPSEEIPT